MAKYQSRSPNQVLCMKPASVQIVNGIPYPVPGQHIRFERGEFLTEDKDKIEYLERHRLFGTAIIRVDDQPKRAAAAAGK